MTKLFFQDSDIIGDKNRFTSLLFIMKYCGKNNGETGWPQFLIYLEETRKLLYPANDLSWRLYVIGFVFPEVETTKHDSCTVSMTKKNPPKFPKNNILLKIQRYSQAGKDKWPLLQCEATVLQFFWMHLFTNKPKSNWWLMTIPLQNLLKCQNCNKTWNSNVLEQGCIHMLQDNGTGVSTQKISHTQITIFSFNAKKQQFSPFVLYGWAPVSNRSTARTVWPFHSGMVFTSMLIYWSTCDLKMETLINFMIPCII